MTAATDYWVNISASAIAALVARILTHPLDTLKVRVQVPQSASPSPDTRGASHASNEQPEDEERRLFGENEMSDSSSRHRYREGEIHQMHQQEEEDIGQIRAMWRMLWKVVDNEGWGALYKGLFIALIFSVPALTVYLTIYDFAKQMLSTWSAFADAGATGSTGGEDQALSSSSWVVHLLSGAIAESVSNVLWCPMEVMKTRMQAFKLDENGGGPVPGTDNGYVRLRTRSEGDEGDGDSRLNHVDDDADDHPRRVSSSSSGAGFSHSYPPSHTPPRQQRRSRSRSRNPDEQQKHVNSDHRHQNVKKPTISPPTTTTLATDLRLTVTTVRTIYRNEGLRGFFTGFWIGLLVYVPHSMIYFVVYERLKILAAGPPLRLGPDPDHLSSVAYLLASTVAAALASAVSNVFDVVKTGYQATAAGGLELEELVEVDEVEGDVREHDEDVMAVSFDGTSNLSANAPPRSYLYPPQTFDTH
ncbi:hypothetical protein HK102_011640 [Quaeritorhiza haematococci]|nr:hypothetical protein HK102_011640 [Quaeritorhiza haematococci]